MKAICSQKHRQVDLVQRLFWCCFVAFLLFSCDRDEGQHIYWPYVNNSHVSYSLFVGDKIPFWFILSLTKREDFQYHLIKKKEENYLFVFSGNDFFHFVLCEITMDWWKCLKTAHFQQNKTSLWNAFREEREFNSTHFDIEKNFFVYSEKNLFLEKEITLCLFLTVKFIRPRTKMEKEFYQKQRNEQIRILYLSWKWITRRNIRFFLFFSKKGFWKGKIIL